MQTCFEKTIGSEKLEAAIEVIRQVEQICSQMRESAHTVSKQVN